MTGWNIEERDWDDPAGVALRQAQRAELIGRYGADTEPGTAPSAADIDVFLIAFEPAGEAVACGALRRLDESSVEVKRMYVVPERRGSGVATAVLRTLHELALARGCTTVRLETGTEQPDARRFYEREGYRQIPLFGSYAGAEFSVCYERALTGGSNSGSSSPASASSSSSRP